MNEIKLNKKTSFLKVMGVNPTNRILDFLIENKRESWAMVEIRDNANVGYSTLKIIIPRMEKLDLIKVVKKVGTSKFYTINEDNPIIKKIESLHREIIRNVETFI